jgi:hypothetical protein
VLPQHAQPIDPLQLTPIAGTTAGNTGWYFNAAFGVALLYAVQAVASTATADVFAVGEDGSAGGFNHGGSGYGGGTQRLVPGPWWTVVASSDMMPETDWALLVGRPTLIAAGGTKKGHRGAYRTFCFPVHRGEVRRAAQGGRSFSVCMCPRLCLCLCLTVVWERFCVVCECAAW